MRIEHVEAIPFSLPLAKPVKFAAGTIASLDHVLVRIRTDDGRVGIGEAPARQMIYGDTVRSIVSGVEDYLGPAILGANAFATQDLWARMGILPRNHFAKAAIDCAVHDIIAQASGVPLFRLLGGFANSVEVCHILGSGSPQDVAAEAERLAASHGLRWFKIKAGLDPAGDTECIAAVRSAMGGDARLTVDCNQAYRADVAERTLPDWERFELEWVEEPCAGSDSAGRARAARACRIPFMLDESAWLPAEVAAEAALGNCRIAAIKTARTGFTVSKDVLAIAKACGMRTVVGSQADGDVGTFAGAHFAAAHAATRHDAAELSFFLETGDRITDRRPAIENGRLVLSEEPGLGAAIDEDRLARLRLDT
ncbi:mandelate racemase/muconate lactonizing enzyme family protein [Pelagerythrobacter sp.]|uniref:mandelate racemase/muconate lactonizing enzyme family protein n=1 Tax=Pelagerythrobacter sp. TaxID=2800702 RepID=UPI0035B31733